MSKSYAAYYEPDPNWLAARPLTDQPLTAQVEYLLSLHGQGKLEMGGPLADGSGGLVIFFRENEQLVQDLTAMDPAIVDGILVVTVKE